MPDDVIIDDKRRYDAFHGTLLREMLRQCKGKSIDLFTRLPLFYIKFFSVDTVVICGLMTNLCCETTARSAFVQDFGEMF